MESLVKFIQDEYVTKNEFPQFQAGDSITVYYEIKEGQKTRTQFFKGTVIQRRGTGASETFTFPFLPKPFSKKPQLSSSLLQKSLKSFF